MRQTGYLFAGDYCGDGDERGGGSGGGSGSGGVSCQDCGNQAKKECTHMRCRTCCRSRGLPCETHVKSTWVPAAKRRERRQQPNSGDQPLSQHDPRGLRDGVAVPRSDFQNTSTELGFHYPAELISPALFRRVRVSGINETNEQMAYQTAISVGGHVFNGILYDHGPDGSQYNNPVESSSAAANQHQDVTTASSNIYEGVTAIDPSTMYPRSHFIAGTPFFPPPRS